MQFADPIRALRKQAGLTQQQLANALGLAVSSVARYESGKRPEGKVLVALYRLAAASGYPELAMTFWNAASEEMAPLGIERIGGIWTAAEAAIAAHAAGRAEELAAALRDIQRFCVEINPGLAGPAKGRWAKSDLSLPRWIGRANANPILSQNAS